jgi:hypothetical protein
MERDAENKRGLGSRPCQSKPPTAPPAIRTLNDAFRQAFADGNVMLTASVRSLPEKTVARLLQTVRDFEDFGAGNDPHGEHDFGAFDADGTKLFWKIDCYDRDCRYGSEDASDPDRTARVFTIMLAEEY